jgi:hypothetical protein
MSIYQRPTYPERLKAKLEERPYRPETIAWIGHVCRSGRASEETVINLLDVLEEDSRASRKEQAAKLGEFATLSGAEEFDSVFGTYQLPDHEGEALPAQGELDLYPEA